MSGADIVLWIYFIGCLVSLAVGWVVAGVMADDIEEAVMYSLLAICIIWVWPLLIVPAFIYWVKQT